MQIENSENIFDMLTNNIKIPENLNQNNCINFNLY